MKRFLPVILAFFWAPAVAQQLPRIAIAGLGIESSTFSPARTQEPAFHARYGAEIFGYYPFLKEETAPLRQQAHWLPAVIGKSLPGGAVTRQAYESLLGKLLDSLKKNGPYDGIWFDIHGAMSVVGLDDPEGDMITRIRKIVGPKVLISASMDLHGNVSKRLAENADLITCYRMAPHEDAMETKERAVRLLLERLANGKGKPKFKAYIPVPILLPGEKTSTRIEPGRSLYAAVAPAAGQEGIIDAAIWIGYAWADEPRNHAVVMVTGDDKQKVEAAAKDLAQRFWAARDEFQFVAPTGDLAYCLDKALSSDVHPFFISDSGDNPTAGGAGDVTWTLQQILKRKEFGDLNGPTLIYASIPGPDLVEKALQAGVGNEVEGMVGAAVDHRYAPPLRLKGTVTAIEKGDRDAEVEVVVKVGTVSVIVTKKRKPYHREADFTRLGLNPRGAGIVVVKIGYLEPELYAMRADWLLALTPGGVDQDLHRLPYKRINRPMFPLDKNMKTPDLSVRWIRAADALK